MKKTWITFYLSTAAFILLAFQACAPFKSTPAEQVKVASLDEEISEKTAEILSRAKQNLSCSTSQDCVSIAIGQRGCGGPSSYTITSVLNDVAELQALSDELAELETERNRTLHLISTCQYLMPPELECKANICSVKPY